jgi:hypothetical protein
VSNKFADFIEEEAQAAFERLKPAGEQAADEAVRATLAPIVAQAEASLAKLGLRPAEIFGAPKTKAPAKPRKDRTPKAAVAELDGCVLALWDGNRTERSSATVCAAFSDLEPKAVHGSLKRLVKAGKLATYGKGRATLYGLPKEGGAA